MNAQCDIGLIGLAVMGQNLILNMADHGFKVAAYNRTASKVDDFLAGPGHGKSIVGCKSPEEFGGNLQRPRRVMLMVKAWIGGGRFILSGFRCDENQKIRLFKDFSQVDEIAAIKTKGFEK